MNSEDGQVYSIEYCNFLVLKSTTVCRENINKQNVNIADETLTDYSLSGGITIINQRIIWKDDIEFVTEFPCFWDTLYLFFIYLPYNCWFKHINSWFEYIHNMINVLYVFTYVQIPV